MLFGRGLLISGKTDLANVLGLLDVFGEWRPELALMMACAAPAFFFVRPGIVLLASGQSAAWIFIAAGVRRLLPGRALRPLVTYAKDHQNTSC